MHVCRQNIAPADIKALIAFFETSQDMTCIEDVLHMVIRAVTQKSLLVSFLEQVNLIGGRHIFVNLLQRYAFCIKSLMHKLFTDNGTFSVSLKNGFQHFFSKSVFLLCISLNYINLHIMYCL